MVLKSNLVEHQNWSSLSLFFFFFFSWFEWIISYLRDSSWPKQGFWPLCHIVSIFWEEWSGLQCLNPLIGQWIHQVYICYFQKIQLFDHLIVLRHGQLKRRFEYKTLFSIKYLYKHLYTMRSSILEKHGRQILIYSYLRHYYPHPYKSEW